MRFLISIGLLLTIIFTGAILGNMYIMNTMNDFIDSMEDLRDLINNNKWEQAEIHLKNLDKNWSQTQDYILIFVDHAELQNLETALASLSIQIEHRKNIETLTEINIAIRVLENIKDQEEFALKNIF